MATEAYGVLHQSQLGTSVAELINPSGSNEAVFCHIKVVNTDTVTKTFNLYINGSADANAWAGSANNPKSLGAGEEWEWDGALALGPTDTLQGKASTASKLTITVTGLTRTP